MSLKKILIVSGTHGNEINPVWAVNKFSNQKNTVDNNIEFKYTIGNPLALERGRRYIENDLNRSFTSTKDNSIYEINRANFLVEKFGFNGSEPCDVVIDLHTTTAVSYTHLTLPTKRIV